MCELCGIKVATHPCACDPAYCSDCFWLVMQESILASEAEKSDA